jgi:hypothetical protein
LLAFPINIDEVACLREQNEQYRREPARRDLEELRRAETESAPQQIITESLARATHATAAAEVLEQRRLDAWRHQHGDRAAEIAAAGDTVRSQESALPPVPERA